MYPDLFVEEQSVDLNSKFIEVAKVMKLEKIMENFMIASQ